MKDNFSLERLGLLRDFYMPKMVRHLGWIVVTVAVVYFILAFFCVVNSYYLYSLGTDLLLLPLYFGPLFFATYRSGELFFQLPASAAEKTVFLVGYTLVVVPLVMTLTWLSMEAIGTMIGVGENVIHHFDYRLQQMGLSSILTLGGVLANGVPVVVSLYVILSCTRHRVLKGIIAVFVSLFVLGIISAVFSFWIFYKTFVEMESNNNGVFPEDFFYHVMREYMPTYVTVYGIISVILILGGIYMVYRKIKRMQV